MVISTCKSEAPDPRVGLTHWKLLLLPNHYHDGDGDGDGDGLQMIESWPVWEERQAGQDEMKWIPRRLKVLFFDKMSSKVLCPLSFQLKSSPKCGLQNVCVSSNYCMCTLMLHRLISLVKFITRLVNYIAFGPVTSQVPQLPWMKQVGWGTWAFQQTSSSFLPSLPLSSAAGASMKIPPLLEMSNFTTPVKF